MESFRTQSVYLSILVTASWAVVFTVLAPAGASRASSIVVALSAAFAHALVAGHNGRARFGGTRAYRSSTQWSGAALAAAVAVVAARLVHLETTLVQVGVAALTTGLIVAVADEIAVSLGARKPPQRAIVVGTGEEAAEWIALAADHPEIGIEIVGCVGDRALARRVGIAEDRWLGPLPALTELMRAQQIDVPIVAVTSFRRPALRSVIDELVAANYDVAMSWGVSGFSDGRMAWRTFSHETLPVVRAHDPSRRGDFAKRLVDITLATLLIVVTSPVMALAAVAIRLDSEGAVLFRQKRVGLAERPFVLLKLRTMNQGAEAERDQLVADNERTGPLFKLSGDPRVTRAGRVLRALSIDELPQLWNVVRGDMSLVGPRPALLEEAEQFDPELKARFTVRPGITGLWQLEARSNKSFAAYRRLDLHYVENRSLLLDLRVMIATAQMLLIGAVVGPLAKRFSAIDLRESSAKTSPHGGVVSGIEPTRAAPRRVAVIGAGYVGLTQAVGLAGLGHEVTCADISADRIADLKAGIPPFLEKGLREQLARGNASGLLKFTEDSTSAVIGAEVVFLCVATPQGSDGAADLTFLEQAARHIAPALASGAVVVNKSTVPAGSTLRIAALLGRSDVDVVSNPEFLREGTAIADWFSPDRIVVGGDPTACALVMDLYKSLPGRRIICDAPSAELIKYASNAYLATRLTFVNSMNQVCEAIGADIHQVTTAMGLDARIGPRYLQPGPGWGGSCLPKDTRALAYQAAAVGADFHQLEATIEANETHIGASARKILDALAASGGSTVALLGLAFKAGTGDTRDSPSIAIAQLLIDKGVRVQAFDPAVTSAPIGGLTLATSPVECARGADVLAVLTEWPEFAALDFRALAANMVGDHILDFRNIVNPSDTEAFVRLRSSIREGASRSAVA